MLANNIRNELKAFEDKGYKIEEKETKKGKIYTFGDSKCSVVVKIEEKWLGVEFKLRGSSLWYAIDTDLYDITQKVHQKFANDIEKEIAFFLSSLNHGKLLYSSKSLLVIPAINGYVVVTPSTRSTYNKQLNEITEVRDLNLEPLTLDSEG